MPSPQPKKNTFELT